MKVAVASLILTLLLCSASEAQLFLGLRQGFRVKQRNNSPIIRHNPNNLMSGGSMKNAGNRYIVMPFARLMVHSESGDADVQQSRLGPIRKRVNNRMGGSNF